jgi:hypothetical protein
VGGNLASQGLQVERMHDMIRLPTWKTLRFLMLVPHRLASMSSRTVLICMMSCKGGYRLGVSRRLARGLMMT